MNAKNKVIAGDYEGKKVKAFNAQCAYIVSSFLKQFIITKDCILSCEVLDGEHAKGTGSGLIEELLPGSLDLLAELSAKNEGLNIIALEFTDGKKSLLEVDNIIFKAILTTCGING